VSTDITSVDSGGGARYRTMFEHQLDRHDINGARWWICRRCGWKGRRPSGISGKVCPGPPK
jgi:hypothetical protein